MIKMISNIRKTVLLLATGCLVSTVSAQQGTGGAENVASITTTSSNSVNIVKNNVIRQRLKRLISLSPAALAPLPYAMI